MADVQPQAPVETAAGPPVPPAIVVNGTPDQVVEQTAPVPQPQTQPPTSTVPKPAPTPRKKQPHDDEDEEEEEEEEEEDTPAIKGGVKIMVEAGEQQATGPPELTQLVTEQSSRSYQHVVKGEETRISHSEQAEQQQQSGGSSGEAIHLQKTEEQKKPAEHEEEEEEEELGQVAGKGGVSIIQGEEKTVTKKSPSNTVSSIAHELSHDVIQSACEDVARSSVSPRPTDEQTSVPEPQEQPQEALIKRSPYIHPAPENSLAEKPENDKEQQGDLTIDRHVHGHPIQVQLHDGAETKLEAQVSHYQKTQRFQSSSTTTSSSSGQIDRPEWSAPVMPTQAAAALPQPQPRKAAEKPKPEKPISHQKLAEQVAQEATTKQQAIQAKREQQKQLAGQPAPAQPPWVRPAAPQHVQSPQTVAPEPQAPSPPPQIQQPVYQQRQQPVQAAQQERYEQHYQQRQEHQHQPEYTHVPAQVQEPQAPAPAPVQARAPAQSYEPEIQPGTQQRYVQQQQSYQHKTTTQTQGVSQYQSPAPFQPGAQSKFQPVSQFQPALRQVTLSSEVEEAPKQYRTPESRIQDYAKYNDPQSWVFQESVSASQVVKGAPWARNFVGRQQSSWPPPEPQRMSTQQGSQRINVQYSSGHERSPLPSSDAPWSPETYVPQQEQQQVIHQPKAVSPRPTFQPVQSQEQQSYRMHTTQQQSWDSRQPQQGAPLRMQQYSQPEPMYSAPEAHTYQQRTQQQTTTQSWRPSNVAPQVSPKPSFTPVQPAAVSPGQSRMPFAPAAISPKPQISSPQSQLYQQPQQTHYQQQQQSHYHSQQPAESHYQQQQRYQYQQTAVSPKPQYYQQQPQPQYHPQQQQVTHHQQQQSHYQTQQQYSAPQHWRPDVPNERRDDFEYSISPQPGIQHQGDGTVQQKFVLGEAGAARELSQFVKQENPKFYQAPLDKALPIDFRQQSEWTVPSDTPGLPFSAHGVTSSTVKSIEGGTAFSRVQNFSKLGYDPETGQHYKENVKRVVKTTRTVPKWREN